MVNESSSFYGILLSLLLFVLLAGLLTSKEPTGFAVKATNCFEGTAFGECSFLKPKYCDNGALKPNCQKCGCIGNEFCQEDGTCLQKCADGSVFGSCSENKPFLCFKGTLVENCFECGCFPGQTCLQDGSCAGEIETGAGAEVKKQVIEEKTEEPVPEEQEELGKVEIEQISQIKETPKQAGFWWNLFCKVFYFNEYDDCISDAISYQNR